MATNWELGFGTPEKTAHTLLQLLKTGEVTLRRKSDGKPMNENDFLEWLQEECDE